MIYLSFCRAIKISYLFSSIKTMATANFDEHDSTITKLMLRQAMPFSYASTKITRNAFLVSE